jgi:hypothetical protein
MNRLWGLVQAQRVAFATGVPLDIYAFHRSTKSSARPYLPQAHQFAKQFLG